MTAIMVDARKPGLSGWSSVRYGRRVRVTGIEDGMLRLHCEHDEGLDHIITTVDTILNLPDHIIRIKAELLEVTPNTRLYVDLIGE